MQPYNRFTLGVIQFSTAVVITYGTISLLLILSAFPSTTRFIWTLSKFFVYNKSRGNVHDVTRLGTLSVNVAKAFNSYKQSEVTIEKLDPGCRNFQKHQEYVMSELPFRCTHLMFLAGNRGRTGNQLFQFAALLGIAQRHNYTAYVKPTFPLLRYFDIPQVADLNISGTVRLGEVKSGVYSSATEQINYSHNYSVDGYFQSWKYFSHIRDLIKKSLKLKYIYLEEAERFVQDVSIPSHSKVCVHVRRGDIYTKSAVKQGYSVGGLDYVLRAMNYFKNKIKKVQFIVVSEDKDWCLIHLKENNTVISPFHSTPIDFAVLTLCDHMVITAGTFGWWGGWLSSGTVIYYRDFPRPNSWLATQVNAEDYYPPHWIPMI